MTGTLPGTLKGALWGAVSGAVAFGVGHGISYSTRGGGLGKSLLHGLSRAAIAKAQGGTYRAGFWSVFASSAFNPGTTMGGNGAEGFTLRTSIAAIVGGTASELGGGKFANGAVSGAFVHMFNAEMRSRYKGSYKNDSSILRTMKDGDIVFGKRALGGLIKITFSGDDAWNTEIVHEQIFYNKGGLSNIGYSDGKWMDKEYNEANQYTFSEVYHVNEVLNQNWFQSGFANTSQYNIFSNNCQDFADYVADKIRWSQGH